MLAIGAAVWPVPAMAVAVTVTVIVIVRHGTIPSHSIAILL